MDDNDVKRTIENVLNDINGKMESGGFYNSQDILTLAQAVNILAEAYLKMGKEV